MQVRIAGTPNAPTFSDIGSTEVTVTWTKGRAETATSYNLYRCAGALCEPRFLRGGIAQVEGDTISIVDGQMSGLGALTPDQIYRYAVGAVSQQGIVSEMSNIAEVTTSAL
jgi:hypothetical protein